VWGELEHSSQELVCVKADIICQTILQPSLCLLYSYLSSAVGMIIFRWGKGAKQNKKYEKQLKFMKNM